MPRWDKSINVLEDYVFKQSLNIVIKSQLIFMNFEALLIDRGPG